MPTPHRGFSDVSWEAAKMYSKAKSLEEYTQWCRMMDERLNTANGSNPCAEVTLYGYSALKNKGELEKVISTRRKNLLLNLLQREI